MVTKEVTSQGYTCQLTGKYPLRAVLIKNGEFGTTRRPVPLGHLGSAWRTSGAVGVRSVRIRHIRHSKEIHRTVRVSKCERCGTCAWIGWVYEEMNIVLLRPSYPEVIWIVAKFDGT